METRVCTCLSTGVDCKGNAAMSVKKRTSTRRALAAAAATAALTLLATGCGSGTQAGKGGDGQLSIGLSVSTLNNPFFVELKEGAEEAAKAAEVELTVTDAQNDASQQANQLQNFTSQNMDAIVVNPVDSDAAGPSVEAAGKAGIPVVAADRTVNGADVVTTVASDNEQGGAEAARILAERMGGAGEVVVLRGIVGTSASRERHKGFSEAIKEFPGIEVVATQPAGFDRAEGLDVMTNLLQSHRGVTGVFAENDEMALGAIKALGDRAGSSVTVVGFDGTPDGLQAVQEGTMAATVAQRPGELGRMSVRNAVRAAKDQEVDSALKVPVTVVTEKNVARFLENAGS